MPLGASLSKFINQLQTKLQSGSNFSTSNFMQLLSCPYQYIKYLQAIIVLNLTVNVSSLNQLRVSYMSRTIKRFSTGLCQASWDRRTTTSSYKLKVLPEKTDQRKTFQINHTSRVHNQYETLQRLCQRKKFVLPPAYLPYETFACCFISWCCQAGTLLILSLEQGLCYPPNTGLLLLIDYRTQTN